MEQVYFEKLSKTISKLLASPFLISGDLNSLQDSFIRQFYLLLQTALDLNFEGKVLDQFIAKTKNQPTVVDIAHYLRDSLENPKTYTLLNYFFTQFIGSYMRNAKKEHQEKIAMLLEQEGITPKDLLEIVSSYEKMIAERKRIVS